MTKKKIKLPNLVFFLKVFIFLTKKLTWNGNTHNKTQTPFLYFHLNFCLKFSRKEGRERTSTKRAWTGDNFCLSPLLGDFKLVLFQGEFDPQI